MKIFWTIVQTFVTAVVAAWIVFWWQEILKFSSTTTTLAPEKNQPVLQSWSIHSLNLDWMEMLQWFEQDLVTMINKVSPSVVSIVATQEFAYRQWWLFGEQRIWIRELWGWSGFLVSRDGYIITNRHVVDDTRLSYNVLFEDGTSTEIESIWLDPSLDIAVVKVNSWVLPQDWVIAQALSLDDTVQVGQFAFAVGNSLAEFQNSVSLWIISWRNRTIDIGLRNRYAGLYQTDASISQWNSWWPLFNTNGQVIGVNTAVSAVWENIGFAIPITQAFIEATLSSIAEYDTIRRPFIWISYIDLDPEVAVQYEIEQTQWVLVQEIIPWSAAFSSGIQSGDIIIEVDGKEIDDEFPLQYLLFTKLPNERITLGLIRNNQQLEVVLQLWEQ